MKELINIINNFNFELFFSLEVFVLAVFIFIATYVVFELTLGWIWCLYIKPIYVAFKAEVKEAFSKPSVVLNLSSSGLIASLFGFSNAEEIWIIAYLLTSFVFLFAIIKTAKRIKE